MELKFSELERGLRLIKLIGRLDLAGVEAIQMEFLAYCSVDKPRVLVDLAQVDFIASTGIRLLLNTAKTVAGRSGKMVFLNPTAGMREVLDVIGIFDVIPVYADLESAQVALLAA